MNQSHGECECLMHIQLPWIWEPDTRIPGRASRGEGERMCCPDAESKAIKRGHLSACTPGLSGKWHCLLRVKKRKGSKARKECEVEKSCASQIQYTYLFYFSVYFTLKNFRLVLFFHWENTQNCYLKIYVEGISGRPVIKTLCPYCQGPGFDSWSWTRLSQASWPKIFKK